MSAERAYANADDLTRFILDEIFIALKQRRTVRHGDLWSVVEVARAPFRDIDGRSRSTRGAERHRRCGAVAAEHRSSPASTRAAQTISPHRPGAHRCESSGAYDVVALIAGSGRDDIQIIASGVPFTRSLIATAPHLIYVNPDNLGAPIGWWRSAQASVTCGTAARC